MARSTPAVRSRARSCDARASRASATSPISSLERTSIGAPKSPAAKARAPAAMRRSGREAASAATRLSSTATERPTAAALRTTADTWSLAALISASAFASRATPRAAPAAGKRRAT